MAATSAHTRTYASAKAMANLAIHNQRTFNKDHPAPWYLLPEEHHDPRGNVGVETGLTPEMVIREYLETNKFGKKHGKLHHKAKPLRETVVVCEARHGREDMEKLMAEFERRLPFRCMYGYLHRDEGRIDKETGIVKKNWHMHIGHTNLIDGELVDPGKAGLRKLQDICAEVLGMERGVPVEEQEGKKPHLRPAVYRRLAREKEKVLNEERDKRDVLEKHNLQVIDAMEQTETENRTLKDRNARLSADNTRLKADLVRSNAAREADEQALERLKNDPDLDLGPDLDTAEDLATRLIETNKALRKRIQESGLGSPQIYKRLKEIKTSDQPIEERLSAMTRFVDELLAEEMSATSPEPEPGPVTPATRDTGRQDEPKDPGTSFAQSLPAISPAMRKAMGMPPEAPAPAPVPDQVTEPESASARASGKSFTNELETWLRDRERENQRIEDDKVLKIKKAQKEERAAADKRLLRARARTYRVIGIAKRERHKRRGLLSICLGFIKALDRVDRPLFETLWEKEFHRTEGRFNNLWTVDLVSGIVNLVNRWMGYAQDPATYRRRDRSDPDIGD